MPFGLLGLEADVADIDPADGRGGRLPQRAAALVAESLSGFAARLPALGVTNAITLDDVVGLSPETRALLAAVISDFRTWQRGDRAWSEVPASFLLHGPP